MIYIVAIIVTVIFSTIFFILEEFITSLFLANNLFLTIYSYNLLLVSVIFIVIYLLLIFFVITPIKQLRKQKIHMQPSWVFYCFHGILWSPIISFVLKNASISCYFNSPNQCNELLVLNLGIRLSVPIFAYFIFYLVLEPDDVNKIWGRFSAGSCSLKDDSLSFKKSAKNEALRIVQIDEAASVVAISGPQGSGKSSYTRMIIESLNKNDFLYSFISLTETNEENDFSKLFAERWFNTLNERYPKIKVTDGVGMLKEISRETSKGWAAPLMEYLGKLDKGLDIGYVKFYDKNFANFFEENNPALLAGSCAKLFGNVPEFAEKQWIIVIDEIERAKFEEVYRAIETVERFKIESQLGFPIKVVFIFCVDLEGFSILLNKAMEKNFNEITWHIYNFFYNFKSIDRHIYLPPVSALAKQKYIEKKIIKVCKKIGLYNQEGNEIISFKNNIKIQPEPVYYNSNIAKYIENPKERYDFIFSKFEKSKIRFIEKVFNEINYFYQGFFNKFIVVDQIVFVDIMGMKYIEMKYPFIRSYLNNMIGDFATNDLVKKFARSINLGDKKFDFIDDIKKNTDIEIPKKDWEELEILLDAFLNFSGEYSSSSPGRHSFSFDKQSSLSLPGNLIDYLSLSPSNFDIGRDYSMDDDEVNEDVKYARVFSIHESNLKDLKSLKLSLYDLYSYSRFVRNRVSSVKNSISKDIVDEIYERIDKGLIKAIPRKIGDSDLENFTYEFIFHINLLASNHSNFNEDVTWAADKVCNFLNNKKISTVPKFTILNTFANNRSAKRSSALEYINAFNNMKEKNSQLIDAVKNVFNEVESRYFNKESQENIYEKEENFFYVLYQYWSGKIINIDRLGLEKEEIENERNKKIKDEISTIRRAAKNKLNNFPDAIASYWGFYPYKNDWMGKPYSICKDPIYGDHFWMTSGSAGTIYMELDDLIKISNEVVLNDDLKKKIAWWKIASNDEEFKRDAVLKEEKETLRAALIEDKLLDE